MPRARVLAPVLAAVVVAGGGVAAGSANHENAPDSGVRGVVLPAFPCPVILESDRPCAQQSRSTAIVIRRARDGKRVATIRTDARGRFHKALEPGTYVFALQDAPAATRKRVVVPPHRYVPVILR